MRIPDFEPTVAAFVEFFMNNVQSSNPIDLEGSPEGFLQDLLRTATGIVDLEVVAPGNYLYLPCLVKCMNQRCSAYGYEDDVLVAVPMDNQYRVICKCGTLPQVIAVFEDGFLQMNVGGVGPGGSGSATERIADGAADL